MTHGPSDCPAGASRDPQSASPHTLVDRMRMELAEVDLECHCRDTLDELLETLRKRLWHQERAQALADACVMRDRIAAFLGFLDELDDLTPEEQDITCFQEIATTFEDLCAAARAGADATRRIAAVDSAWRELGGH